MQSWNLLVVDNASSERLESSIDTSRFAGSRVVREDRLGKMYAMRRGIEESSGELILFLDDDNFLEPDYLLKCIEIAKRWPMLGVWGGRILPDFEQTPPEWTRKYWSYLTILDCPHDQWSNFANQYHGIPPGAGLVIRRDIALVYAELLRKDPIRLLLDRSGTSLVSGGDTDMAFTACDLGYGAARFSSLELRHYMPARRFEEAYLLRMVEGMAYSLKLLDAIRGQFAPPRRLPMQLWQYLAGFKLASRDRRFWHAQLTGSRRADQFIAKHPELQTPRDSRRLTRKTAEHLGIRPFDQPNTHDTSDNRRLAQADRPDAARFVTERLPV